MTQKRPPLWLNTDIDDYLRKNEENGASAVSDANADVPIRSFGGDGSKDRRSATREFLSGFAVIHTLDPDGNKGRYRLVRLCDISTAGIGLRLNAADPESFHEGREFEILFQFAGHGKPLHMACTACRKALDETGMIIGAVFKTPLRSLAEVTGL